MVEARCCIPNLEGSWRPSVPSLVSMVWKESDVAVKTESSIQDGKHLFYNSTPRSSNRNYVMLYPKHSESNNPFERFFVQGLSFF